MNLFAHHSSDVLALGIGRGGIRIAQLGAENAADAGVLWAAAHTDSAELIATGLEQKLFLKFEPGPFAHDNACECVERQRANIEKLSAARSTAIIVGSVADPGFNLLAPPVCAVLREAGLFVIVLAREPYAFENSLAVEALPPQIPAHICARIPAELLSDNVDETSALSEFSKRTDSRFIATVEALAGAFSAQHCAAKLSARAFQGFSRSGAVSLGLGVARGEAAALQATQAALRTLDVENDSCVAAALAAGRELTVAEAEGISALIHGEYPNASVTTSRWNHFGEEAVCVVLAHQAAASNVVSIADALAMAK